MPVWGQLRDDRVKRSWLFRWTNVFGYVLLLTMPGSVRAADDVFIAIGGVNTKTADGHKIEGQFGTIYTSPDGESWKQVFSGGPVKDNFNHARNNMLRCLTFGHGKFVATGNADCVVVSEDAVNWRVIQTPHGAMSIEFGNGTFLAPTATRFMTSADGTEWETRQPTTDFKVWGPDGAGHVRKTVFGNGVFVCVGENRLGVTRDGRTWLHHEVFAANQRPGKQILLFGNGRFVWLTEENGPRTSVDGIDWAPITGMRGLSELASFGSSGVFDGRQFLVSAAHWKDKNKIIHRSTDGVTWAAAVENAGGSSFCTAGNGLLLQNNGWSRSFSLSADGGRTWKQVKPDVPSRKVYFFDGDKIIGQSGG